MDLVVVLEEHIQIIEEGEEGEDNIEEEISIMGSSNIPIGEVAIPVNKINLISKEQIKDKVSEVVNNLAFKEEATQEVLEINKKNSKFVHFWINQMVVLKALMLVVTVIIYNKELFKIIMVHKLIQITKIYKEDKVYM